MGEVTRRDVVKRIMRCLEVFDGIEVFLFAEPAEKVGMGGEDRGRTINDIIDECREMLVKPPLLRETA